MESQERSRRVRIAVAALLLFIGIELWFLVMHGLGIRRGQPLIIAAAALLAMVKPLARSITSALDRVRHPSVKSRRVVTVAIFLASIVFLYIQAIVQHRDFGLRYQDEFSYSIQTLMLAHGRLWEPAHPLPEFFESFQLIATPVYASVYFPGAAMSYAPGVWLHLPRWVMPLIESAAVIAMVYTIFVELIDGLAGLLGAILIASNSIFREQSLMVMAQVPAMLGALLLIRAYLRWRASRSIGMTLVMGAIAGWLAITRPVDALIAIIPVAIGTLTGLRNLSWKRRSGIVVVAIAGMLPFLILQGIFNLRVTGKITETPFADYTCQVYPLANYGFHGNVPSVEPSWPLPQVHQVYRQIQADLLREHTPAKTLVRWCRQYIPDTIQNILPHSLLIVLMPVGILGLRKSRWILAAMLPLFVILYFPYVFFIRHYSIIVVPAGMMLIVLGIRVLADLSPSARPQMLTFLVVSVAGLAISEWPTFNRLARDEFLPPDELRALDHRVASVPHQPAIVLFRYTPGDPTDLEPVYNVDVIYPDDARIIRAHDRGADNLRLFEYYAQRQPDRWVYLFDRHDGTFSDLGPVTQLAKAQR